MLDAARLLVAISLLVPFAASAQSPYGADPYATPPSGRSFKPRLELAGLAGYHISSDFDFSTGSADVEDAPSYGAALRAKLAPGKTAELLWIIVPTDLDFRSTLGSGTSTLTINYFQLGGTAGVLRGRTEPYVSGTLGAAVFSPGSLVLTNGQRFNGNDIWRFAFTLGGGVKIWLAEKLALQLEARLMAPVWFSSAGFYAGTGGSGLAVSGGIPIWEGNFSGGLVFSP